MDLVDLDDDEQAHVLHRSKSWSHSQRPGGFGSNNTNSRPGQQRSTGLSCIYETEDHTMNSANQQEQDYIQDGPRNRSKSVSGGSAQAAQMKKRRHSYTELIASAILSSSEKRKTLAEIYDWFVLNVPSFKDQRYMHSSLGWKNAVRHNLSVQTCFKRVKRHGMEKPSWWTVDMSEVAKRRLVLRPTVNSNDGGDTEMVGDFLPPRRNTYSGPNPMVASTATEEMNGKNRINHRVASTNDLISAVSNSSSPYSMNSKRSSTITHYPPIRPAVTATKSNPQLGNNQRMLSGSGELAYYDSAGHSPTSDGNVFMQSCHMDTNQSNEFNRTLIPSVTLVCKETGSPTNHPYRQAQLEVSLLQQTNDGSIGNRHSGSQPSSPPGSSYQNWSHQPSSTDSITSRQQLSPNVGSQLSSHYRTWPTFSNAAASGTQETPTTPANQTLRVKTAWGNVQDISFNGLLPMRTVVKCDGMTQTEEGKCSVGSCSPNPSVKGGYGLAQWDMMSPNGFELFHDPFGRDYANRASTPTTDLPEDLAGLQIEGDIQCDIDEVLCASLDPSMSMIKPTPWMWNCQFDHSPFGDGNLSETSSLFQSTFTCGKMDVSEL